MRKRIIAPISHAAASPEEKWLDLENLAAVEITSEESSHPIESALLPGRAGEWRAAGPGKQTIRLVFDRPQQLRRISLRFDDPGLERTQEYLLRWSPDGGRTFRDIVRQQWNFSRNGATSEVENHGVDLPGVTVLELSILPDISGNQTTASLAQLRLA
jgi:hypothetical protein